MKKSASIALIATLLAFTTTASAQFAKPDDAIKYRKNALFVMQQNFGRVSQGVTPFQPHNADGCAIVRAVRQPV